jgi:hypothetical protein
VTRGRVLAYPARPYSELLLGLLHRLQVPATSVGDDGLVAIDEV